MFLAAADYPLLEITGTIIIFFAWLAWFSAVINILADVFRRHDISGWAKAGWAALIVVVPFLGVLIYIGSQGAGMAQRAADQARERKTEFDQYVREAAGGGSSGGPAGEIAKAKSLLDSGAIDQAEFDQLKRKALA